MKLNLESKVKASPQVAYRNVGGRMVLVKTPLSTLHQLTDVAGFIWEQLNSEKSIQSLVDDVVANFEIDLETAQQDVTTFIEKLLEKELVVIRHG